MTENPHDDPAIYAAEALRAGGVDVSLPRNASLDPDPAALVEQVLQAIAQASPPGWTTLYAAFSMAGGDEIASAVAVTPTGAARIPLTSAVVEPIRLHRKLTVGADGPWLRLMFECDDAGALQVTFDYGDQPLPDDELLPRESYLRDLDEYPRETVPLWLLAYIGNEGQQLRTAAMAVAEANTGTNSVEVGDEIPPFNILWARMAALAAITKGIEGPSGVRADPSFQVFTAENGACTIAKLPGGRGVLSGGRLDSLLLTEAYKGRISWPNLYAGAPVWLHNLYLDPSAGKGLLSFCYWWDGTRWFRSELLEASHLAYPDGAQWTPGDELTYGVPGIWTAEGTETIITNVLKVIGVELTDDNAYAPYHFVRSVEAGIASERCVKNLFADGVPETFDTAEALAQLDATDTLVPFHTPIDQTTAIERVVQHCRSKDFDTTDYPLESLIAARMDMGWEVFVPIDPDEIAIGRTVFLVADDGVVEQASTSAGPNELAYVFASRFAERVRGTNQ